MLNRWIFSSELSFLLIESRVRDIVKEERRRAAFWNMLLRRDHIEKEWLEQRSGRVAIGSGGGGGEAFQVQGPSRAAVLRQEGLLCTWGNARRPVLRCQSEWAVRRWRIGGSWQPGCIEFVNQCRAYFVLGFYSVGNW